MNDMWISLISQIPFVAVFVWYSLEVGKQSRQTQDRYMDALDKRDNAYEARSASLVEAINANSRAILDTLARMEQSERQHYDVVLEKLAHLPRSKRPTQE